MSPSTTGPTSIRKVRSSKGAWPSRTICTIASGPRTSGAAVVDAGLVDEEVVGHQLLGHRQVAVPQLQHPAAVQPPEVVVLSDHAPIVPGRPRR
jgi:hypothetical protein